MSLTPELFLQFANACPEPILLLSGGGQILAYNRGGEERLGNGSSRWPVKDLAELVAEGPDEVEHYLNLCARSRQPILGAFTVQGDSPFEFRAEGSLLRPRTEDSEALLMLRLLPRKASADQFVALNLRIEELGQEMRRRKSAEKEAREAAERLRVTLASIGDGFISTNAVGQVVEMNSVAESMTGWSNSAARGRPLTEVFHIVNESTRLPVENPAIRAIREGVIVGLANHTILIARDGSECPIDDSAAPIRTLDGQLVGSVLVFRDISDRRSGEVALEERARLTNLRAELGVVLASADPLPEVMNRCCEKIVQWLGVAFARIWSLDPVENVLELQASAGQYTHLDGPHSRVPVGKFKIGRIASSAQPHLTNSVADDPNIGDPAWAAREGMVAFAGYPLKIEGRVVGVLAMFSRHTFTDTLLAELEPLADSITQYIERKKSEDQLADALRFYHSSIDALSSHIAVLDENGVILEVNHAWRSFADRNQFAGFDCGVGANYIEVCETSTGECSDDGSIAKGIRAVLAGGKDVFEFEYPCHSPTEERWFLMRVTRFKSPGPVRVVVSHDDVTQRRAAEHELRKVAAELSEADRRKNEFLATLAHELRNPLAPIRNGLQVIRAAHDDPDMIERTRVMMDRQLTQLVRLVDDLLDLSRISTGRIELRKEQVTLEEVVNSAVETSRPMIEQMGHSLSVRLPRNSVIIEADMTRLAQVFSNLLSNAGKYSEANGRIWLTANLEGNDIVVSVKDTGIGIPEDQLTRIFDMFSQVDRASERSQGGLGIGLSLVKRLVELHGGDVVARSEGLGKGSEFILRLPVVGKRVETRLTEAKKDGKHDPRMRVLVVDDNRDSADSMAMMIKMMGNDTCTAYDGEEAVAAAATFRPDVILLDIGLPKLNGYEACRRIRDEAGDRKILIVAQTGWGQEEDRQRARDAGFDHHIVKPVDFNKLEELLKSVSPREEAKVADAADAEPS